jgi:integrase/recombinase XerD|nr:tyrosine-type recombinase/integrase [uncultured Acetatifactor sp.]
MMYRLTKEAVAGYQRHMEREEYAPETVKKYLRDIRAFAAWAVGAEGSGEKAAGEGMADGCRSGRPMDGTVGERADGHADGADGCSAEPAGSGASKPREGIVVERGTAAAWKGYLVSGGYAPVTVNAMLSSLNSLFRYLGWEECRVRFLKVQRRTFRDQGRELSRAEYRRLLGAAGEAGDARLSLLLETMCATGIRVSEVRYVTVEAVARRRADISLKGKVRTILIPGKLCRKLKDYARRQGIRSGEIFITRTGRGMSRRQIWQEMKRLCGRAQVSPGKVFPHNLRHLFARVFHKACGDIVKLADVLGHSSIETTRIYLISTGEVHARRMERLGLIS